MGRRVPSSASAWAARTLNWPRPKVRPGERGAGGVLRWFASERTPPLVARCVPPPPPPAAAHSPPAADGASRLLTVDELKATLQAVEPQVANVSAAASSSVGVGLAGKTVTELKAYYHYDDYYHYY